MYPFVLLQLPDKGYMQIPREFKTITEILKEQGYDTMAFNSNPLLTYYREYWRGFDLCDDPLREKERNRLFNLLRNLKSLYKRTIKRGAHSFRPSPEKVNKRALSFLKNTKQLFSCGYII